MEKDLIERYKAEMFSTYAKKIKTVAAAVDVPKETETAPETDTNGSFGFLNALVTSVRRLYFVPNAKVTVFKGDMDNKQILDTAVTDQNGRITPFRLETPPIAQSQTSDNTEIPYTLYNLMVEADGYLTNVHMNVPVFPSITTVQPSNLLLLETAGTDKGPRVFDEKPNYNL